MIKNPDPEALKAKKSYIQSRLIDAVRTHDRVVKNPKPKKYGMDSLLMINDELGSDEFYNQLDASLSSHTIRGSNKQVTHADEALDWIRLVKNERHRKALCLFLQLSAKKRNIDRYCKKNGINRVYFYKQKNQALQYLVAKLSLRHHLRDFQEFDTGLQNQAKSRANHIKSDEFRPRDGQYFQEGILEYDKKGKAKRVL